MVMKRKYKLGGLSKSTFGPVICWEEFVDTSLRTKKPGTIQSGVQFRLSQAGCSLQWRIYTYKILFCIREWYSGFYGRTYFLIALSEGPVGNDKIPYNIEVRDTWCTGWSIFNSVVLNSSTLAMPENYCTIQYISMAVLKHGVPKITAGLRHIQAEDRFLIPF
jgi:hypothetical protein